MNWVSTLVMVDLPTPPTAPSLVTTLTAFPAGTAVSGITLNDFKGDPAALPGQRTGLISLEEVDEISILCCPDENRSFPDIGKELAAQAEKLRYRFAILQSELTPAGRRDHKLEAVGGGQQVRGVLLSLVEHRRRNFGQADQDSAQRSRHRHLRAQRHRARRAESAGQRSRARHRFTGRRIEQGAPGHPQSAEHQRHPQFPRRQPRTAGLGRAHAVHRSGLEVHQRAPALHLSSSTRSTAARSGWCSSRTTSRLCACAADIADFLRAVWRDGALHGRATPEEAYFVKCDRTTMSQNDIDNGRLIVEIGIAAGETRRVRDLPHRSVDRRQ